MKSFINAVKSVVIVMLLVCILGLGLSLIKNCETDTPSDYIKVEDVTLNETNIVF